MRHLWSLLAGLVVAPLAWLLLSTGQFRSMTTVAGWDQAGRFDTADLIAPAAFLAAAGVLLGLLGTLRWSPAGPLVAGGLYIVPTVLMFIDPFDALDRFLRTADGDPRRLLGQDLQPWLPVENGTLLVVGALLLMAVLSGQRWRRWPAAAGSNAGTAATPATPATAGMAGMAATVGMAAKETSAPPEPAEAAGGAEQDPPTTMTDDEILAAAAAYEEAAEHKEQETTSPGDTEPTAALERTVTSEDEIPDRSR